MQLAVSEAASQYLPRHIDFLIKETYNWFAYSSLRQERYKTLYETINNGQQPHKIVQMSQTRWLSIESAVSRILDQWLELKTFFETVRNAERCYTAETLYNMYNDDKNFAIMSFLRSKLVEVQKVNKLFESSNADPTKLLTELSNLLKNFVSEITLPHAKIDIYKTKIEDFVDRKCYLGYGFENTIRKLRETNLLSLEEENNIRERLRNFTIALIKQIRLRLPENFEILEKICNLSVDNTLKHHKASIVPLLEHCGKSIIEIEDIERQWRNVHLLKWCEVKDTKLFWAEVYQFKDAGNDNPFLKLATFAFEWLILPYSKAKVERLFSKLNIIKTKLRNLMKPETIASILYMKCGLKRLQTCCDKFEIPNDILKKIKTKETYETQTVQISDLSDIFNVICEL